MTMFHSIGINYKTWILYVVCSTILCDCNIGLGITTFVYSYLMSYLGHRLLHIDVLYPNMYAISHYYHHINTGIFSLIISGITEFLMLTNNLIFKFIIEFFKLTNLYFINNWVTLFVYILYTTTHNINYGYFHINTYHEKHHSVYETNLGPDFFDLLFFTKNKDTPDSEVIDHFIPNIFVAFIIVYFFKRFCVEKKPHSYIFALVWAVSSFILCLSAIKILYYQIDEIIENDLQEFLSIT